MPPMLDFFGVFAILTVLAMSPYIVKSIFVLLFYRSPRLRGRNIDVISAPNYPKISVVLPVYNEENVVKAKIQNLLELDYPRDSIEIIVVDGCSTDRTVEIVKASRDERIKLIRQNEREGVTEAVRTGVQLSKGEIVVMTDAEAAFEPSAFKFLVDDFTNPDIGAVTGIEVIVNPSKNTFTKMESMYRRFYHMSSMAESIAYSTSIGFRGEFVGFKKELFPMTVNSTKGVLDVEIALGVIRKGYRAIVDERIKFFGLAADNLKDRNRQKIQRATLNQETILQNTDFLFRPKFKTFGLITFPSNFVMYFISPLIFLTLLGMLSLFVINCIMQSQILTLAFILAALSIAVLSARARVFILAFFHAQLSLVIGILRILFGKPKFLSQVKSTRNARAFRHFTEDRTKKGET
jgi:biofilm PGA synthesis N-glycosyltransferase PgaC